MIHSIASFSEVNFPKWLFLPLGHVIRRAKCRPFALAIKLYRFPRARLSTLLLPGALILRA